MSAVSYNNYRKQANVLYNWAIEKCYSKQNAFEKIKSKRKEDKKRTIIPSDMRTRITEYLESIGNIGFLLVCHLTYSSLLCPNEIRQIKIENIHLKE